MLEKIYKYKLMLFSLIIVFGIQHYYLQQINFEWVYYEKILNSIFILSVFTVLFSVFFLIYGSIKTINKKPTIQAEKSYLIVNLFAYYFVIWISLYLSGQIRG